MRLVEWLGNERGLGVANRRDPRGNYFMAAHMRGKLAEPRVDPYRCAIWMRGRLEVGDIHLRGMTSRSNPSKHGQSDLAAVALSE